MGYRSDLYAYVHGSDLIDFMSVLKETELESCFERIDNIDGIDEQGYARFRAESLKWYNGYKEVDAINSIFNNSIVSVMLRVGEEVGDLEYITKGDYKLKEVFDVTTTVSVDF